jgi:hypothetical protein
MTTYQQSLLNMQYRTVLPSTYQLEPSEIQRVESLMTVPFHLLPSNQDRRDRETLGTQRLKETLCSVPFYANRAAKAEMVGQEWEYWKGLWRSGVNSLYPAKK